MKTLYIDCPMGAAGDMLAGALLELIPEREGFIKELNGIGLNGVKITSENARKCGIAGTKFTVTIEGEERSPRMRGHGREHGAHGLAGHAGHCRLSGMSDIERIVEGLALPEKVRCDVMSVYKLIAEGESRAHGVSVTDVHFHEAGTIDAIADISAVCLLMDRIKPERVTVSPVCVGGGTVKCAHGTLPVPAPATVRILRDVPIYGGSIKDELCTPTGAALLKYFADGFGDMPLMKVDATGYGMGTKDFETANCVRAFLGKSEGRENVIAELKCNLDDMTGEAVAFAGGKLLSAGALDVCAAPVVMKKSRPGIMLSVLCEERDRDRMAELIFKHTTTLGVRETISRRRVLDRAVRTMETPLGKVREKIAKGCGVVKSKYEFDDIARIADENGMSMAEAARAITEYLAVKSIDSSA